MNDSYAAIILIYDNITKQTHEQQQIERNNSKMGTSCNTEQSYESRFKNKYEFISQVNDHNFGEIKVYRKKELNYDYVMVLYKYIQASALPKVSKEIEALHAAFLKQNQPMALRIFNFDIDDNQISNCSLSLVKIYVEYFNFTLHDLIDMHRQKKDCFTYDQLKFIVNSCVVAYRQFVDITQKNINVSSKSIYLTPEGAIKFCPIRFQEFYQHSTPLCNAMCNETAHREVVSLERGQKYLTTQVKKIFHQIGELNYYLDPQAQKISNLIEQVKRCHSLQSIIHKIGSSKVQALTITKLQSSTSENNSHQVKDSNVTAKPISSTSHLSEKFKTSQTDSVKLSLTRNKTSKMGQE